MLRCLTASSLAAALAGSIAAQIPAGPMAPPLTPQTLPPTVVAPAEPDAPAVRLPLPEDLRPFRASSLAVKRVGGSWQVWAGGTPVRDLGDDLDGANEVARVLRELHPTQWATIGTDRPVVEYGLTDGKPAPNAGFPKAVLPIDHRTARVESVRGAWCLRDDANILLNFGPHRADAEQALAVGRKYGFNRIGTVGKPAPVLTYFFAAPEIGGVPPAAAEPAALAAVRAVQERNLTRTGIEVPGVGFVGEKIAIDPRKVEVRRDRGEYILASGADVLARFGPSEWAARDAAKLIQQERYTEYCRFGTAGVTFFLHNGRPPERVPFFAQGQRFDPNGLKVRELSGKWWLFDGTGRPLLPAGSAEEADQLVKLIRGYGFDQVCQVGSSPRASLKFLAKTR